MYIVLTLALPYIRRWSSQRIRPYRARAHRVGKETDSIRHVRDAVSYRDQQRLCLHPLHCNGHHARLVQLRLSLLFAIGVEGVHARRVK